MLKVRYAKFFNVSVYRRRGSLCVDVCIGMMTQMFLHCHGASLCSFLCQGQGRMYEGRWRKERERENL